MRKVQRKPFALCIDNTGYLVSLVPGKVYKILPDPKAARHGLVRIVDESGEAYYFDKSHFVFVDFPPSVRKKLLSLPTAVDR